MVKGRRGRPPTKGTIRTRSAALAEDGITSDSPRRKETRVEFQGKLAHSPSTHGRIQKTPTRITSYFHPNAFSPTADDDSKGKENGSLFTIRTSENQNEPFQRESLKVEAGDQIAHILLSEDIICSEFNNTRTSPRRHTELFKTDETPVAVPISGPPTPHRINMPETASEEPEVKPFVKDEDCKVSIINPAILKSPSSALSQMQIVPKKATTKGRRKLNPNQTVNQQSLNSVSNAANHKLTDYFPVRRSVRKCKKTVLEEQQRDMENKVLCQVEDGLEVRQFAGKGRGIVTTREFRKGEFVVEYLGELIDQTTAKKREAEYAQDQNTGCYMYYFQHRNHQYCVDATPESKKLGRLVNHSRNGNLIARVVEIGSTPHLVLTAKEDISAGVEVTYDYGDRSREAIRNHPWLAL